MITDVSRWFESAAFNKASQARAPQKQTKTVFDKEWSFLPQSQNKFTLNQGVSPRNLSFRCLTVVIGNYEYPFQVLLPDDIPVSIEGLPGGAIVYKMKATVERTGLVQKNVICRKV